jgi:UDP-GlcNAc3NAcA epimerase
MKVNTIVGARPQFVKASVVSLALREKGIAEKLIHTGQHYDENMSAIFFGRLDVPPPSVNLGIGSGRHGLQTGRMLEAIEAVLADDPPEMVITYGDTNSTLAGALAAAKLRIPVAHIEAGMRTFERGMPEEVNRVLTDHASDLLFPPTPTAVQNLLREGIEESQIYAFGDVMYDAALLYGPQAERESRILDDLQLRRKPYVLVTVHRAENTDNPERLEAIFTGLLKIAGEIPIVLPLHPRTKSALQRRQLMTRISTAFQVLTPTGYFDMVMLEKNARLIVTDSGGVQKEAFFHRVPCLTLRERTEWLELVELGWNRILSPTSSRRVAEGLRSALDWKPSATQSPYGEGRSAQQIAEVIGSWISCHRLSSLVPAAD